MENGDLGHGIRIGGVHEGIELLILACSEQQRNNDWVRSGWLYSNQNAGAYLAVAFFKIHRAHDHSGYIHIRDVASPPHVIWLKAEAPEHQQGFFHHASMVFMINHLVQPAFSVADWRFTWS